MRVVNLTTFPTPEVERILRAGYGRGPTPQVVTVHCRRGKRDNREGWTPYDHRRPSEFWLDPASAYPQAGARSWRAELWQSAAHEAHHLRHPGEPCPPCEQRAEAAAQSRFRRFGHPRRRRRAHAAAPHRHAHR